MALTPAPKIPLEQMSLDQLLQRMDDWFDTLTRIDEDIWLATAVVTYNDGDEVTYEAKGATPKYASNKLVRYSRKVW